MLFLSNIYPLDKLQDINVMYIGDSLRISADDISKVTVTNSKVIKVLKEDKVLALNARAKGSTTIYIWKKGDKEPTKYSFTIMSASVHKKVQAVRESLKGINGIKVSNAGESVYITGMIYKKDDMDLINKVVASQKDVMNYVKLADSVRQGDYNKLTDVLLDMGLYDISVKKTENVLFVGANARTKGQAEKAQHYLDVNFPSGKIDIKVIPYQIDIDVKIVEVSTSMGRQMGLELPGELSLTRHTVLPAIEIDSILHLSESHGDARILSNPSLSTNDGEGASFHAGGAIPIKLSSRYSSNLEWKNYGVILNFTPKVINDDTVELSISSEFSSLDSDNSYNKDVPGFVVREVKTVVTMDSGKSVVISGLINRSSSKANKGLPAISDIPVLSDLFSSNDVNSQDTELAIIVTASIRFRCEELFIDKKLEDLLAETLGEDV
ncbi:MAG: pilus assembly protein N-terminal domain-containing protein [Proteobacteria bacterium]|nr:pilus assembly protein N-terminal domain-containing protein [Pseudomonadota bacterium]